MDIEGKDINGFHVLNVRGKLDQLKDSISLKSYINTLIEQKKNLIALNLSGVTYLDSGALNVLIYTHNVLKKNDGDMVLIQPSEYVLDVIEVVGLNKLVQIYPKMEDFEHDTTAH